MSIEIELVREFQIATAKRGFSSAEVAIWALNTRVRVESKGNGERTMHATKQLSPAMAIPAAPSGLSPHFEHWQHWKGSPILAKLQPVWLNNSPSPMFLD